MSYTVIHGTEPIVDRRQTASECLELVLILEAQAEPGISILDPAGGPLRRGRLEGLQRKEVERKYLAQSSAPFAADGRERSRDAKDSGKMRMVGSLAALMMLFALIGSVSQFRGHIGAQHGIEQKPANNPDRTPPQSSAARPSRAEGPDQDRAMQTRRYKIEAGDTLAGIAKKVYRNQNRWRDIAMANPRLDPRRLHPGEIIILP